MNKLIIFFIMLNTVLFLFADWTIVQTYEIPDGTSGLASDGEFLYCGIYGVDGGNIYRINPQDGSYELFFIGNHDDCYGLTYDGNNLWTTDHPGFSEPGYAIEYDMIGNQISTITLPDHYMSGIAYNDNSFWVTTYYISGSDFGRIYNIDLQGNIILQYDLANEQPWDLCFQDEFIWIADYYEHSLIKIEPSNGDVLETHPSEHDNPAGVVFDGTYLWYSDEGENGVDYLYKVDLGGSGNPEIHVDIDNYDFGNVVVGIVGNFELEISNLGSAPLEITGFSSDDSLFIISDNLPITINIDETQTISVQFIPQNFGLHQTIMSILSNDPVNSNIDITLTAYALEQEPTIVFSSESIHFEDIRLGAYSSEDIFLSNQGAENLVISDLSILDTRIILDENIEFPIEIETRDEISLRLWYNPIDIELFETQMILYSNDPVNGIYPINIYANSNEVTEDMWTELWYLQANNDFDKIVALKTFDDITGDGYSEVLACDDNYQVLCINGNSSGEADLLWRFSTKEVFETYGSIYSENAITCNRDLDMDGFSDIVIGTAWGGKKVIVISGINGELIWSFDTHIYGDGGWVYQVEAFRDFDSDDIVDVLACAGDDGSGTGPQRVFLLNGIDGEVMWETMISNAVTSVISIEDINNDFIPEVVCGDSPAFGESKIYLINGENGSVLNDYTVTGSSVWALQNIGDVNNDSNTDFLYGDFSGNIEALSHNFTPIWASYESGIVTRFSADQSNLFVVPVVSGSNSITALRMDNGESLWSAFCSGNMLDVSVAEDFTADNNPDVLVGTLNNQVLLLDGLDGQTYGQFYLESEVEQVTSLEDINDTETSEILVGLRNGKIICYSSGRGWLKTDESALFSKPLASLEGNFPNPIVVAKNSLKDTHATKILFTLYEPGRVNIDIYNILGQKVKSLIDAYYPQGTQSVSWDATNNNNENCPGGVYFYRLSFNNRTVETKKCMLIK